MLVFLFLSGNNCLMTEMWLYFIITEDSRQIPDAIKEVDKSKAQIH